jgi:hypothetical protein
MYFYTVYDYFNYEEVKLMYDCPEVIYRAITTEALWRSFDNLNNFLYATQLFNNDTSKKTQSLALFEKACKARGIPCGDKSRFPYLVSEDMYYGDGEVMILIFENDEGVLSASKLVEISRIMLE